MINQIQPNNITEIVNLPDGMVFLRFVQNKYLVSNQGIFRFDGMHWTNIQDVQNCILKDIIDVNSELKAICLQNHTDNSVVTYLGTVDDEQITLKEKIVSM